MARPKQVRHSDLPLYLDKHTMRVKMFSGTEITALYLLKQTEEYYISIESWAFCCSTFKVKKKHAKLQYNIPVLSDSKSIAFLEEHAWHDWTTKETGSSVTETLALLENLFPNKRKVYFYELESIIGTYCHGSFVSYDDSGKIEKPSDGDINQRMYYTRKYINKYNDLYKMPDNIKALYEEYRKCINASDKIRTAAFKPYYDAENKYVYENFDLTDTFIKIGESVTVCPYAFSKKTFDGSSYDQAGEVFFIVTQDAVYFEIKRHY